MLEHLELGPAWIAGNSSGASIALRLAGERPDLCRGLIAHEPPLLSLLADDPIFAPMLGEVNKRFGAVVERVTSGDAAGAAEQFVDTVAVGPGTWAKLSADQRQIFIENAPTFVDEAHDAEAFAFDLTWLEGFSHPMLFTTGTHSPPMFAGVLAKLTDTLPNAKLITLPDAGHIPQETHPDAYAEAVTAFIHKHLT